MRDGTPETIQNLYKILSSTSKGALCLLMTSIHERMQQAAQKAMLQNAFFRWESALTVSGTILLTVFYRQPFPFWPWWGWLVLGLLGELFIVWSSLTDKDEQQRIVEALFREKYNSRASTTAKLRAKLSEAEQYHQRIRGVVEQQKSGILRDRHARDRRPGLRLDRQHGAPGPAHRCLPGRPGDPARSEGCAGRGGRTDTPPQPGKEPAVREQISANLASTQQLAGNLQELNGRMERADLQLDHSLAALGTVYSQMLLVARRTSTRIGPNACATTSATKSRPAGPGRVAERGLQLHSDTMSGQAAALAGGTARRAQASK